MGLLDALLRRPSPEVTFLRNEVRRLEAGGAPLHTLPQYATVVEEIRAHGPSARAAKLFMEASVGSVSLRESAAAVRYLQSRLNG
ncbi:MAG: hypothetical protein OEY41_00815 [Acidimicrobiia bacterium]|nr:hypothetical protein [Acidimicrobiia bacterium]MDH4363188.1 hypothetical protein [Acidimicrobiia bacterium]MDH5288520.1 hypothetical protein [Acidimicrobiia bacterium]